MSGAMEQQAAETMRDILIELAASAPNDAVLMPDRFAAEPPAWATWEDMGMYGEQCGRCDSWVEVVRPGKTQCPTCGDNDLTALAIRAKAILGNASPAAPELSPAADLSPATQTPKENESGSTGGKSGSSGDAGLGGVP